MADVIAPLFTWRTGISLSDLQPTTRHVLMAVSIYMNEQGESAFPSQALLARDTGYSERTVGTHIRLAVSEGFLIVVKNIGHGQSWAQSFYEPDLPEYVHARVDEQRQERKNRRSRKMQALSDRYSGTTTTEKVRKLTTEGEETDGKKVRKLTTEGEETDGTKVRKEVPTNTPINSSVNTSKKEKGDGPVKSGSDTALASPADLTNEQALWQAKADEYIDPLPGDSKLVTIAMLEDLPALPPQIAAKPLRMQLMAAGAMGVPAGLFVEWLVCVNSNPQYAMQQLDRTKACAAACGVTPVAVLLYSLEKYRDTSTPEKQRFPCFPRSSKTIADKQPSRESKRAAQQAPNRAHLA